METTASWLVKAVVRSEREVKSTVMTLVPAGKVDLDPDRVSTVMLNFPDAWTCLRTVPPS